MFEKRQENGAHRLGKEPKWRCGPVMSTHRQRHGTPKPRRHFPPNETRVSSPIVMTLSARFVTPVCRIHAEQAILALSTATTIWQAMRLMYQSERKLLAGCRAHCRNECSRSTNSLLSWIICPGTFSLRPTTPKNAGRDSADAATSTCSPDA